MTGTEEFKAAQDQLSALREDYAFPGLKAQG